MEKHNEDTAESEIHEHLSEFQVIQTEEGAIMLGSTVVSSRVTGPGEVRGTASAGARKEPCAPAPCSIFPRVCPTIPSLNA
jgi:hypothetical protein